MLFFNFTEYLDKFTGSEILLRLVIGFILIMLSFLVIVFILIYNIERSNSNSILKALRPSEIEISKCQNILDIFENNDFYLYNICLSQQIKNFKSNKNDIKNLFPILGNVIIEEIWKILETETYKILDKDKEINNSKYEERIQEIISREEVIEEDESVDSENTDDKSTEENNNKDDNDIQWYENTSIDNSKAVPCFENIEVDLDEVPLNKELLNIQEDSQKVKRINIEKEYNKQNLENNRIKILEKLQEKCNNMINFKENIKTKECNKKDDFNFVKVKKLKDKNYILLNYLIDNELPKNINFYKIVQNFIMKIILKKEINLHNYEKNIMKFRNMEDYKQDITKNFSKIKKELKVVADLEYAMLMKMALEIKQETDELESNHSSTNETS